MQFRKVPGGVKQTGAHVNLRIPQTRKALERICVERRLAHSWRDWQSLLEVWLEDDLLIECVPRR
jgi:hypothetical protein